MFRTILGVVLLMGAAFSVADQAVIEAKYNKSCIACHASGAAGAPISFDQAVWEPRLQKGEDVLLANVISKSENRRC